MNMRLWQRFFVVLTAFGLLIQVVSAEKSLPTRDYSLLSKKSETIKYNNNNNNYRESAVDISAKNEKFNKNSEFAEIMKEMEKLMREQLKASIQAKLESTAAREAGGTSGQLRKVPDVMRKIHENHLHKEHFRNSAKIVRSLQHTVTDIDDEYPDHHQFRLYYNLDNMPATEVLKAAELYLTRSQIDETTLDSHAQSTMRYEINVHDLKHAGVRGSRRRIGALLATKTVSLNSTEPLTFDVQEAVERWRLEPRSNHGLLVEVRAAHTQEPAPHHHVRLRRSVGDTDDDWLNRQPLLLAYTSKPESSEPKSRTKRQAFTKRAPLNFSTTKKPKTAHSTICQLRPLMVQLGDLDPRVISPQIYDAKYCSGRCPTFMPEHLSESVHAIMQMQTHSIFPDKIPAVCCAPTELTHLGVMYSQGNETVSAKWDGMIAHNCGCL